MNRRAKHNELLLIVLLLLLMLLLTGIRPAQAQGCAGGAVANPSTEFALVDVVFVGDVVSIEPEASGPDGPLEAVVFNVSGSWKRELTGQAMVRSSDDECKVPFKAGEKWVVYAYDIEGKLFATSSGSSAVYSTAGASLDPIRNIRPAAGSAIPQDFGETNVVGYFIAAYVIFFALGGAFYYLSRRFARQRRT